jgi:four helix bundle protein
MNVNYKNLKIWQRSLSFCQAVYLASKNFPESEKFGLTNQLRRAVVSIPSNIAEGAGRKSKVISKDFYVLQKVLQTKLKHKLSSHRN